MKNYLLIYLILLFSSCKAQAPSLKNTKSVKNFENQPALQGAHFGISIRELSIGKEILEKHSKINLIPASNLKLLYTLAAIDKYGDNFRFHTRLFYSGKIENGTLNGDLIFQPDGDPVFAALRFKEDLDSLLQSLTEIIRKKGIREIKGKIKMELNGWRYPAAGSWPVEDIGNYYGTGAWDFNFRDNRIDVYLQRSNKVGGPTKVLYTIPEIPGIKFISKVKTAEKNTGDQSYVYAAPFDKTRYILGTVPVGTKPFKVKAGIPNPPLSFLKIFEKKLNEQNIQTNGVELSYQRQVYRQKIWEKISPSLLDIVKKTNDYSMNHYSEALGWLLIYGKHPSEGYMNKDSINQFFKKNYGLKNIDLEDASGLAPDNLISPSALTQYLFIQTQKLGLKKVLDILPHGGIDGYAKYFLKNSPVQQKVWVKSGSVSKVRNYTGIFQGKSGKYYAFSVMTNLFVSKHKEVRKAIENLVESLIKNY